MCMFTCDPFSFWTNSTDTNLVILFSWLFYFLFEIFYFIFCWSFKLLAHKSYKIHIQIKYTQWTLARYQYHDERIQLTAEWFERLNWIELNVFILLSSSSSSFTSFFSFLILIQTHLYSRRKTLFPMLYCFGQFYHWHAVFSGGTKQ